MNRNVDKELWDKIGFNTERFEYVKLPWKVGRILRRKVGDEVLLSYYYIDGKKRIKMLNYVKYDGETLHKGPGYCCEDTEGLTVTWEDLAKELAETYAKYAVRHRK